MNRSRADRRLGAADSAGSADGGGNDNDRAPKCPRCRHHGIISELKRHKPFCRYRSCMCRGCILIMKRKQIKAEQVSLRRQMEKDLGFRLTVNSKDSSSQWPRRESSGNDNLPDNPVSMGMGSSLSMTQSTSGISRGMTQNVTDSLYRGVNGLTQMTPLHSYPTGTVSNQYPPNSSLNLSPTRSFTDLTAVNAANSSSYLPSWPMGK